MADIQPTHSKMDAWKIVVVVMIPLLVLASAIAGFFAWSFFHGRDKRKREEDEIHEMVRKITIAHHTANLARDDALKLLSRAERIEDDIKLRQHSLLQSEADAVFPRSSARSSFNSGYHKTQSPAGSSRPQSPETPTPTYHPSRRGRNNAGNRAVNYSYPGSLQISAPGLEHFSQRRTSSGSSISMRSHECPSTIPEENEAGLCEGSIQSVDEQFPKESARHRFSPMKTTVSHPDMIPAGLKIAKRSNTLRKHPSGNIGEGVQRPLSQTPTKRHLTIYEQ